MTQLTIKIHACTLVDSFEHRLQRELTECQRNLMMAQQAERAALLDRQNAILQTQAAQVCASH